MNLFEHVQTGEALELNVGVISTRTKLERIEDETHFSILQPTYRLLPIQFEEREVVLFIFFRPNGIYTFKGIFLEREHTSKFQLCRFEAISEVEKNQRRFSYRLPTVQDINVRRKNRYDQSKSEEIPAKTINLSQGGIYFSSFKKFAASARILIEISLKPNELLILNADVLRCELPLHQHDPYRVAAKFVSLSKRDQYQISRFILDQQIAERRIAQTDE